MNIQELLQSGLVHHQSGRLQQAEQFYRRVLAQDPANADACNLLGILAYQAGNYEAAVVLITKATETNPSQPAFFNNLGNALKADGALAAAGAAYRQALALKPDYDDAFFNLGNALMEQGKPDEAEAAYRKALALMPGSAEVCYNLGNALMEQERLEEAMEFYNQALALEPHYTEALYNLGNSLMRQERLDEAAVSFRKALAINPGYVQAHNNLGRTLSAQGNLDAAAACFRRALDIDPDYVEALNNLGISQQNQGCLNEALASYRRALAIKPDLAATYNNLGNALKEAGSLAEAAESCRRALALKPDYGEAHTNLGLTLLAQGFHKEAVASFRQALAARPEYVEAHSALLFSSNYMNGMQQEEIYKESVHWEERHARGLLPDAALYGNTLETQRRLRIGYLSPDFRDHSVAAFFEPVLMAHNREKVEIFCYANVKKPDHVTSRLEAESDHWRPIAWENDSEVADKIKEDAIDILVDLAGHTGENRLLVFARRPAPVQVTWLGYPNTTGLSTIDYRLTDAIADPAGEADRLYTEELVHLAHGFLCYQPDSSAPETGPLPCLQRGCITFGSFNNLAKVTPEVIRVWASILQAVPDSHLLLKAKQLGDKATRERYLAMFTAQGIDPDRIEQLGMLPGKKDHLTLYHRVDIGLDPFPYNGTTTTCEALWMGVPVVTLQGDRHSGRVGASILHRVGQDELVAASVDEYARIARALAHDRERLLGKRARLRSLMQASELMDSRLFTGHLEDVYRKMWHKYCVSCVGS